MEKNEFQRLKRVLVEEISLLGDGDNLAEIWMQATQGLSGMELYGLQRIGLYPEESKEDK